jgi:hypothetical protein
MIPYRIGLFRSADNFMISGLDFERFDLTRRQKRSKKHIQGG